MWVRYSGASSPTAPAWPANGPDQRTRRIGLIGGTDWLPMVEYHGLIQRGVAARSPGRRAVTLSLRTVEFDEGDGEVAPHAWHAAGRRLAGAAVALEDEGAEAVVLCSACLHAFAPLVRAAIRVPLLHVAAATASALRVAGVRHVLVLTAGRAAAETLRDELRSACPQLTVSVPGAAERDLLRRVLRDVRAEAPPVTASSAIAYVVGRSATAGAEAVVVVSDELEPLIGQVDVPLPLFDATALHADAVVGFALGRDAW